MDDSFKTMQDYLEKTHNMNTAYSQLVRKELDPLSSSNFSLQAESSLAMQCQQCSVTLPVLINLPFSHFHLIKNNYLFILGASRAWVFSFWPFFYLFIFISHHDLLSHVDWHTGFMSFIAVLTCSPIWFISQSLSTPS